MQPILVFLALSLGMAPDLGAEWLELQSMVVSTATLTIPTYPYSGFLEPHHSDIYNMDYEWLNWSAYEASNPQPVAQDYIVLVIENSWLRLTFLPELGGRLYGVTVKATGEEVLYQNPVIKPTHWGPPEQGWWLAVGGIEWCLPVEEHGYEWGVPWSYTVSTTAEGTTVILWDTTATDRVRAQITVYLPADQAAFRIVPRLENPTGAPVSLKFWENAMLAPGMANTVGPELRFVMPVDQVTVHSRGDEYLPGPGAAMDWPVHGGTDYSRLGNWNRWLGFFARPQAAQDWVGAYDEAALCGVARVFPQQVAVGAKGFAFGWGDPIGWQEWTDDGSTYVELHGGPSPTFGDAIILNPGESLEWTETWLPIRDLPALSLSTSDLALGVKSVGEDTNVGLLAAGQWDDLSMRLWHKSDCTLLWHEDGLSLFPGEAYTHGLIGAGLNPDEVVLGVFGEGELLAATGNLVCPPPESQVNPLDAVQPAANFVVSWSGSEIGQELVSYDVQVRDGDAKDSWTDWLTETTATSAIFGGQDDHTYTFRSRARDAFGNLEGWPTGEWQDAFTTVLLEPAPVLITSDKVAWPQDVYPGDVIEFRIHLSNTGNLAADVYMVDSVMPNLTLVAGPWITPTTLPEPWIVSDTDIVWAGQLAAGQTDVVIGFDARVTSPWPGEFVYNRVWIEDGVHLGFYRDVTVRLWRRFYLPVILKN